MRAEQQQEAWMGGYQSVTVLGNLGKDPELVETKGDTAICKFSVAVGERKKEGGEWVEHTEWFSVVCFGKTAENAVKFLAKGRQVLVDGRLSTREYTKDGEKRRFTELVAHNVVFVGGADKGEAKSSGGKHASGKAAPVEADPSIDDQLPF